MGAPCEECGHGVGVSVEYDVVWSDDPDAVLHEDGPELCLKCGRRLIYEVTWTDEGGRG
ncbi:MAG: hypothetical protein M3R38_08115 [Actinomycetota bacterium]|nr:hypothetical protein [Actinomycetota bacterium]